jgi:predicted NUDIX family NTP pyrophosphohydrolase
MYRRKNGTVEYLLVHNGLPFYRHKENSGWTIPKGLVELGEDLLVGAQREFQEETSFAATGPFIELGTVEQRNNKTVHAWGFAGDLDPSAIKSNMVLIEWPHKSGRQQQFPEIDRGAFFTAEAAKTTLGNAQVTFIDRLEKYLTNQ